METLEQCVNSAQSLHMNFEQISKTVISIVDFKRVNAAWEEFKVNYKGMGT